MAVDVTYDGQVIAVRNGDQGPTIHWSPDMWESAVWRPIVDGGLPVLATRVARGAIVLWDGRQYAEGLLEFGADDWSEFEARVRSGELSVEDIVSAGKPKKDKGDKG